MIRHKAILHRRYKASRTDGVFMLFEDGKFIQEFASLEREHGVCIPKGIYIVKTDETGKHRYFKILQVPNRSAIEIHIANKVSELSGCIGLGMYRRGAEIRDSKKACDLLKSLTKEFILEIK